MISKYLIRLCLAATVVAPAWANAQTRTTPVTESVNSPTALPFGDTKPVDNAELNKVTGQADLAQVVNAQNNGVVSGNSITGESHTGTINFDSNSFQNLNGLSLLSANTGNNVSINSSLNVNVSITTK